MSPLVLNTSYLLLVVAEDITFGIADTQPHDANMLTRLRNNQPTYFIINDHNGHSNQDATLYNYDDNRNVGLMLQTGNYFLPCVRFIR